MEAEKYTFMIIPDDDSKSRSYFISKKRIQVFVTAIILFLVISIIIVIYAIQNLSNYSDIKNQHNQFASERLKVLDLTRDLSRIKQMDDLIRKSLGSSFKIDSIKQNFDSASNTFEKIKSDISYIENIPSFAPISGFISQHSGAKGLFVTKSHHGIDIVAKEKEPILAAASGVVVFSGWTYEYGNQIILYHGDDYFTLYGHNNQNFKSQLEIVERGEVIGLVGSTGISSGPHLHFEVWKEFEPMDPFFYFPEYSTMDLTLSNE